MSELVAVALGLGMVLVPFMLLTGLLSQALWAVGVRGDGPVDALASAGVVVLASMLTVGFIHLPPVYSLANSLLGHL
ncbi:MAG: hypothetical protein ACI8PZ_001435 [Myxococcota bacterium]|jgi:hypothetical protein